MNPAGLLNTQIEALNDKIDNLNIDLTSVLKSLTDVTGNIKRLETSGASNEILTRRRKQWTDLDLRKQNIIKKLRMLEAEVGKKEKEKKSAASS